ncbi:hypothetical protein DFS34DRAFT_698683 [Phlyctochytrium arcticum]|nr:hypothetical protein DFS34DRAFT_698683 [Phlyctochytrium arcticum]
MDKSNCHSLPRTVCDQPSKDGFIMPTTATMASTTSLQINGEEIPSTPRSSMCISNRSSGNQAEMPQRVGGEDVPGVLHVGMEGARAGSDYHSIELIWRRTNQNDPLKGSIGRTSRMYPATKEEIHLDAFYYLKDWVEYLNNNIANALQPDDYLLPQITQNSKTGVSPFRRELPLTTKMIGNYLQKCITGSNLLKTVGAGYKFMYAKMRWSLKAVRWWGGWAKGESKDVIIKYLLEELGKNEDDYGDMMRPGRAQESSRLEYFSPEDAEGEKAVTKELQNIRTELAQTRRDLAVMDCRILNARDHQDRFV